jgi:enolase
MPDTSIAMIRAREILDSRGRPTVEADVLLSDGTIGRASVPSGASTGRHEAVERRDRDPGRYRGYGVREAVSNVIDIVGTALKGAPALDQQGLDTRLIALDGTPDKAHLGANALLAVSLAACRAAATCRNVPLYRHIADLANVDRPTIPLPMVNMISGGLHAGGQIDIQDVLAIPRAARSFSEALETAFAVYAALADRMRATGNLQLVADEGGWAPRLERNEDALRWVWDAIQESGVSARLAVDVASTHFYGPEHGSYRLAAENRVLSSSQMVDMLSEWMELYPVVSIEDGLGEDDWNGWQILTRRCGNRAQLLGDDLFTTNPERLRRGVRDGVANAVLVKPNQIGTLWEALEVIRLARSFGYRIVVSARSGETEDSFLADLAVGTAAGQIKVGSVTRSSRLAKWNQLLRIEEELGVDAYVGWSALEG